MLRLILDLFSSIIQKYSFIIKILIFYLFIRNFKVQTYQNIDLYIIIKFLAYDIIKIIVHYLSKIS